MAADWNAIKTEYLTTNTSYRKLAQKYGLSYNAIGNRARAEDWQTLRDRYRTKTETKTLNALSTAQASRAARLQTVADKLLGKIETLIEEHEELLMDTQSLRHISATLKDIKEIQFIKSDADMREQEARIKNLQKQAASEEESKDIVVTIAGGLEEYSG